MQIEWLTGSTPMQGEGTVSDGRPFYFRARYESWTFEVFETSTNEDAIWLWGEPWGDDMYEAGYMSDDDARSLIESVDAMLQLGVDAPRAYVGMPDDERAAHQLAGIVVRDIWLYYAGDDLHQMATANARLHRAGQSSQVRPPEHLHKRLAPKMAEGRDLYQARVDPKFHGLYEDALAHIDAWAEGRFPHDAWLYDEASARSVARRWASEISAASSDRARVLGERAARWLPMWTVAGAPREAYHQVLG